MELTAVESFYKWFNDNQEATIEESVIAFERFKLMEKNQSEEYAKFCIKCDRKDVRILEFDEFIKL